jgi:hypothetical protein
MLNKCPKLGDMMNKEGHKPLTYWMLELNSKYNKIIVKNILEIIAEKTDMSEWKESKLLDGINEKNMKSRLSRRSRNLKIARGRLLRDEKKKPKGVTAKEKRDNAL